MKLRKVLSLIIAFAMIMTASTFATAFAFSDVDVDNEAYEAISALSALNILTGYEDGTFLPDGKVTRAEFATIIMRARGYDVTSTANTIFDDVKADHWASGAIAEAFGAAIVNGRTLVYDDNGNVVGGTFDPEAEVTYEEATKMIVCALGYERMATSMVKPGVNPYPTAYNLIANQKSITTDVPKTAGGASRATIARLVWNALPVNTMSQQEWGTEETFKEDAYESLLWKNLDAVLVEEAKITSVVLDPEDDDVVLSGARLDKVSRNNSVVLPASIDKGACNLDGLYGLTVKAIVDWSDPYDPVLLAVFPLASNKTLEVVPALFVGFQDVDTTTAKFEYYKSVGTTTTTTAKVEYPINIYSNMNPGKTITNWTGLDAIDASSAYMHKGEKNNKLYRFVDTDNDGYYDTIYIDNSYSMVVTKVKDNTITSSSSNSGAELYNSDKGYAFVTAGNVYENKLVLDEEDENLLWSIKDTEGNELEIADIQAGDVVTYTKSVNGGFTFYDITVSQASEVTGLVERKYTESRNGVSFNFYVVAGKDYLLNNEAYASLSVGDSGTFKVTADDKIISFEIDAEARNFGVVLELANSDAAFSSGMAAQIALLDGTVQVLDFADKCTILGTTYDNTSMTDGQITTWNGSNAGKIVMFELNSEGKIKNLFADSGISTETNGDYVASEPTNAQYVEARETFAGKDISEDTVIIVNASYGSYATKANYSVADVSALVEDTDYAANGNSYDTKLLVDKNDNIVLAFIDGFVVSPAYNTAPALITSTSQVSANGVVLQAVKALVNGEEIELNVAEDVKAYKMGTLKTAVTTATYNIGTDTTVDLNRAIEVGDAIQYTLNGAGEINTYRHVVKAQNNNAYFMVNASTAAVDNKDTGIASQLVEYPLNSTAALTKADIVKASRNITNATGTTPGFAFAGFVESIKNSNVNVLKTANSITDVLSIRFNGELPLYAVNEKNADEVKLFEVLDLDTVKYADSENTGDALIADKLNDADHVLYIMAYDGDAVFQYTIDMDIDN